MAAVVVTLAFGIAASTLAYSLLNSFFIRPLLVRGPERLVHIYFDNTAKGAAPDDARRILRMLKSATAMSDGPARFS
jgi:hypothetical protein